MKLLAVAFAVGGLFFVQYIAKLLFRRKSLLFSMALLQLLFAILLWVLFKVNFSFAVRFDGIVWFSVLIIIMIILGRFLGAQSIRLPRYLKSKDIVAIALLLPLSEELIFRGTVLSALPIPALNALIFTCIHLPNIFLSKLERFSVFNLAYRFAVGMIFADATLKSGSIFPALFYHVANNSLALLISNRPQRLNI